MDVDEFFAGYSESKLIFDAVLTAASRTGPTTLRVSKSQIALVDAKPFVWVWIPGIALRRPAAPLVLTVSFREARPWSRWKQISEAAPRRFSHHLELWTPDEVDEEVFGWIREARQRDT